MPYTTTITATIVPDITYKISCAQPVRVFYMGQQVYGTGYSGVFIASTSVHLVIESDTTFSSVLYVTEIMTNFYDQYDGTGGVYAFQNAVDRWTSKYGFRPEWMSNVANRFVTFKDGFPYIHNGPINTFYGQVQPSAIAGVHSEAGNTVKVYDSIGIEGDTPTRAHIRTESPYVQSTDVVDSEFIVKEGVKYAGIKRDRLSPNVAGGYNVALWKGDKMRGEVGKFIIYYLSAATKKALKFVNIGFNGSTGQTV